MISKIMCWLGHHRDWISEDRTVKRWTTEDGEHEDVKSLAQCRCGVVIKSESHTHTTSSRAVYAANEVPEETLAELQTIEERA